MFGPERVRMVTAALASRWSDRRGGRVMNEACPIARDIVSLQRKARDLRMKLQKELSAKIRAIKEDDPNREWLIFRLEKEAMLLKRRQEDLKDGMSADQAYVRHRYRIRQAMSKAVLLGAVPEKIGKGPQASVPAAVKEERKRMVNAADAKKRRTAVAARLKRLKLCARICGYYVDDDEGTSEQIAAALNWYESAATTKFRDYDTDEERMRLETHFRAAILEKLPEGAEYHLNNCFRIQSKPGQCHNLMNRPCVLNLGHQGECRSKLESDTPGRTIGQLLKPLLEPVPEGAPSTRAKHAKFVDCNTKDQYKSGDAIP
jgi:hypothetical protein